MAFEVHREPIYRRYYASNFSAGCWWAVIFGWVLIFLPLIIAYNSNSFWLKYQTIYEQPQVTYKYKSIYQFFGSQISTGDAVNLFFSTNSVVNQIHYNNLRVPVVKSSELDDNRDGKVDRIEINVQMPVSSDEKIDRISAIFITEVKLSAKAKYQFEAVSYVDYESASPIGSMHIDGDLMFRQTNSLISKGGYRVAYSDDELMPTSLKASLEETSISYIMQKANSRNLTMNFVPRYQYSDRYTYYPTDKTNAIYVNATIILRIPEQPVRYTPPVSEVLKFAWIQYISFFAVISFLLFRLNSFVFRHQLIHTYAVNDVQHEKFD